MEAIRVNIRASVSQAQEIVQPVPVMPPGAVMGTAHDFNCADPRAYTDKPYAPRVFGTKYIIPEAHKYQGGNPQKMAYAWARLWYDCFAMYCPKGFAASPANLSDGNDWSWLGGFIPKSELDKWWLHLIHPARAYTNKMAPPDSGYYDPVTHFGDLSGRPFQKEAVTTGGNYVWRSSGNKFWALDGLESAPSAEQLRDKFFLLHISTQSTPIVYDATKRPDLNLPNGIWDVIGFPQAGGNIVVHPLISTWANGQTMVWNGLHLREAQLPKERVIAWPQPEVIPWPFIPARKMIVKG